MSKTPAAADGAEKTTILRKPVGGNRWRIGKNPIVIHALEAAILLRHREQLIEKRVLVAEILDKHAV